MITVDADNISELIALYSEVIKVTEADEQSKNSSSAYIEKMLSHGLHNGFYKLAKEQSYILIGDISVDWLAIKKNLESYSNLKTMFMLTFAYDDSGNSFHIYDGKNIKSPIIFTIHDPEVFIVVADNLIDFFNDILTLKVPSKLQNYIEEVNLDDNVSKIYSQKLYNGDSNELGLSVIHLAKSLKVDFSTAKKGSGVKVSYFGELTKIKRNLKKHSFSFVKPSSDDVKKHNTEKLLSKLFLIGVPFSILILLLIYLPNKSENIWLYILLLPIWIILFSIGAYSIIWLSMIVFYKLRKFMKQ